MLLILLMVVLYGLLLYVLIPISLIQLFIYTLLSVSKYAGGRLINGNKLSFGFILHMITHWCAHDVLI